MPEKFVKYRSSNDKGLAAELCQLLSDNNIPFEWESTEGFFDASFVYNDILNIYYVKLRPSDFKKADELLLNSVTDIGQQPKGDYYLFSFSDEELLDILKKPDEWNAFDLYWAKKILTTRNIEVNEVELEQAKLERLTELKKPWTLDKFWVFGAFTLLIVAFWFVLFYAAIGVIFTGGYIWFSKKTLPDGQRVKAFSETDRLLGKIVFFAGTALLLFNIFQYYGLIEFMHPL